jgi:ubiquinone/menaquinone biosynthesis C-methylase UbiE
MQNEFVIARDWGARTVSDPKYESMLSERDRALGSLPGYQRQMDVLMSLLDPRPRESRILDVGGGYGFRLMELSERGWKSVHNLEMNAHKVMLMAEVATSLGVGVRGWVGDACRIPFVDASFDVVMSWSSLNMSTT